MEESQINRVYCPAYLDELKQYTRFKTTFAEIIAKDSSRRNFEFSEQILEMHCLDVDALEAHRGGPSDKTMDCACPIAKFNDVSRDYTTQKLLLVELKLNCVGHRLSREDYVGKITHTRALLLSTAHLHDAQIFLFTDSVKSRVKHDVERWKRGSGASELQNVQVMSPKELNDFIGFECFYPYHPLNEASAIQQKLQEKAKDVDALVAEIQHWRALAQRYKYDHNLQESTHIYDILRQTIRPILLAMPAESDEKMYLSLSVNDLDTNIDAPME
jgi:hypothetical protein